jgi:hypothetical protein
VVQVQLRNPRDEITRCQTAWYVSASEAAWRLRCFPIHDEVFNVFRLDVHLPFRHNVVVPTGAGARRLMAAALQKQSKLMGWFESNKAAWTAYRAALRGNPNAPMPVELTTRYCDYPSRFTWSGGVWKKRRRGFRYGRTTVSRMYHVFPSEGERFFLRLLLCHVTEASGFDDLKQTTHEHGNVHVHPTFRAACVARGLLQDHTEWDNCLREATLWQMARGMRHMFAGILAYEAVADAPTLWRIHRDAMALGYFHQAIAALRAAQRPERLAMNNDD